MPAQSKIENDISEALLETNQIDKVHVNFGVMNDEERAKVRELVHGDPASTAGSQPAHGHAEGRVHTLCRSILQNSCLAHRLWQRGSWKIFSICKPCDISLQIAGKA